MNQSLSPHPCYKYCCIKQACSSTLYDHGHVLTGSHQQALCCDRSSLLSLAKGLPYLQRWPHNPALSHPALLAVLTVRASHAAPVYAGHNVSRAAVAFKAHQMGGLLQPLPLTGQSCC